MKRAARFALAVSGLIPVLGLVSSPPQVMMLIYSLFVLALFLRPHYARLVGAGSTRPAVRLGLLVVASGLLAECLAWTNNYLARAAQPALLHPQLIPDLVLGLGFYGGWALAWAIMVRWFRCSLLSVFCVAGVLGILTEQNSQVLVSTIRSLATKPLASVAFAFLIFLVYGSIMGLAYLPLEGEFRTLQRRHHWIQYPLALLLMWVLAAVMLRVVALPATLAGLIPDRRPIWEHPLF